MLTVDLDYCKTIEAKIATFRKEELRHNCLITAVVTVALTWLTIAGLGFKNRGPLSLSTLSRNLTVIHAIGTSIAFAALVGVTLSHHRWVGSYLRGKEYKEPNEGDRFLLLHELRPNEKVFWTAETQDATSQMLAYHFLACKEENNPADLIGSGEGEGQKSINKYRTYTRYSEVTPLDLRIRRSACDLIYPVGLFALLMVGGTLLAKYKFSRELHLTLKQANQLLWVHGIIAGFSLLIVGFRKVSHHQNKIQGQTIADFIAKSQKLPRREMPDQKVNKLEGTWKNQIPEKYDFDTIGVLARDPHIPAIHKLQMFIDLQTLKPRCAPEQHLYVERALTLLLEGGPDDRWTIALGEKSEHGETGEQLQAKFIEYPGCPFERFAKKFNPPLPPK